MNIKKNKILLVVVIILVVIVLISFSLKYYNKKKNENNFEIIKHNGSEDVINNRESIKAEKNYNGLVFQNIVLSKFQGMCSFEADVINTTGNAIEQTEKKVIFKDKEGKEISTISIAIDKIENNEKFHIYTATYNDVIDAYTFEIAD